ncbi:Delta-1-pyrroline-5-carboxylate dehydrogenase 12A1 [Citrus sinensis]|uniref:Delta-1-pyrroline-5-carboxylate dehydrogenase 12A1 n=1 Tax=Citrus sinensis TaxID=2711 RepID=A0ACB8J0M6_CITSI|nr:Delta-1-pyrroline-5-carboxylate dehydrogenase 12A1 [Citrus sinensis]
MLSLPKVSNFFTRLIQRVSPKSYQQALGEVQVTQKFLENFCGDQVRFLARLFAVPGNHLGQQSHGYRWPYGPVAIITPFNFPLEIPVLQLMGALYMGNKPILKVDSKVSIVMEQMMRLLHYCGLPVEDVDFINSDGKTMNKLLMEANPRMTLFTGSSRVAEKLAVDLKGRVKLEDAGFDWKILGPDVNEVAYVSWVCDQDAYACSGQKCSAQSVLFMHENWSSTSLLSKMKDLADRRKLEDLTVGPVLTLPTYTLYSKHSFVNMNILFYRENSFIEFCSRTALAQSHHFLFMVLSDVARNSNSMHIFYFINVKLSCLSNFHALHLTHLILILNTGKFLRLFLAVSCYCFGLLDCKPTSFGLDFGLEGFQTDSNRSNPEILYNYIIF